MEKPPAQTNAFTDKGRLLQVEYAIKNVQKAGTIAGIACRDGVVLIGVNLSATDSLEKIYKINKRVFCAVAGVFGDALRLIKIARHSSALISENIGELPRLSVLCDSVAKAKQECTHRGGSRPFGVSFLYAGYEDGEYMLYSTDPSGTVNRWSACSYGENENSINNYLRNDPPHPEITTQDGLSRLMHALDSARESTLDTADKMEILIFQNDGSRLLKKEEIQDILRVLIAERNSSENL